MLAGLSAHLAAVNAALRPSAATGPVKITILAPIKSMEISDEEEDLLREFWAVRERILPPQEVLEQMSQEEVLARLSDLWMALVEAGFYAPAERGGTVAWNETKKGDQVYDALSKLGLVTRDPEDKDEDDGPRGPS